MESIKEYIYGGFYTMGFLTALWAGIQTGFRGDSHTPPIPFGIEFIVLFIGLFLLAIDLYIGGRITYKKIKVHIWGLLVNSAVIGYCVMLALSGINYFN